ncbi:hypothetical protein PIB30_052337 [Stylosanthes scabra]|uniref:Uncharacterized protein n=1 Tax=Stylosanthes scabra TaxID=79078 RepID=A0ABU6YFK3_9FABA|nr:hypothetical protein [Stylosanthes scabra]
MDTVEARDKALADAVFLEIFDEGLDAKMVMLDEITVNKKSFSVGRVLVDCFQWEPIQEWISIRCEGTIFDVYIKEFGSEILSKQVHPADDVSDYTVMVNSASISMEFVHGGPDKDMEVKTMARNEENHQRAVDAKSPIN